MANAKTAPKPTEQVEDEVEFTTEVVDTVPPVRRLVRSSRYDDAFKAAYTNAVEGVVDEDGNAKPIRLRFPTHKDASTRVQHIRALAGKKGDMLTTESEENVEFTIEQRYENLYITCKIG